MRRNLSIALLGLAALASLPAAGDAQEVFFRTARRAWLGLSYETHHQGRGAERTQTIVITDVVSNSPAQRAGLEVGDTLVQVNGINATDQLLSSLGVSLDPGDEVDLTVLRDGSTRDLTVEAAEPPANYYEVAPNRGIIRLRTDSIRDRVRIMIDSARIHLDSLNIPNIYIERMPLMWGDSLAVADSTFRWRAFALDSLGAHLDSLGVHYRFFADSVMNDSSWQRWSSFELNVDSLVDARFRFFSPDSFTFHGFDALPYAGISVWGARTIAGAELTELNPGLGEYFGTDNGVLVVRVPGGTPAAEAGLESGDVIIGADGRDITSIEELRRAILRAPERTVRLELLRRQERMELEFRR